MSSVKNLTLKTNLFQRLTQMRKNRVSLHPKNNNRIIYTNNMTFEVPESKSIDIEAWTEDFRGKWQDDNMTAEEFVREIRAHRDTRQIVEL